MIDMQAPEPQAVNQFVWVLLNYNRVNPDKWVVVHCTHGYNRTGVRSAAAQSIEAMLFKD